MLGERRRRVRGAGDRHRADPRSTSAGLVPRPHRGLQGTRPVGGGRRLAGDTRCTRSTRPRSSHAAPGDRRTTEHDDPGRRIGRHAREADQARRRAVHPRRAAQGPRGRVQPLVRARPLLRRLHDRRVDRRRAPLRRHRELQGAALPGRLADHRPTRRSGPTSRSTGCSPAASASG